MKSLLHWAGDGTSTVFLLIDKKVVCQKVALSCSQSYYFLRPKKVYKHKGEDSPVYSPTQGSAC